MLKRIGVGFAAGYVLGARAGEKRYKQIVSAAKRATDLPGVGDLVDKAPDSASHAGRRLVELVRERARWLEGNEESEESEESEDGEDESDDEIPDEDEDDEDADEDDEESDDEDADVDDEDADVSDEDEPDNGEPDDEPDDGERRASRSHRSVASSLGGLVSAAKERGRVA